MKCFGTILHKRTQFLWSLQNKRSADREREGVENKAGKLLVGTFELKSDPELNQQRWRDPGRGNIKCIDPTLE